MHYFLRKSSNFMAIGEEEGSVCGYYRCEGLLFYDYDDDPCYCHVGNAPCSNCEGRRLTCDECYRKFEWDEGAPTDLDLVRDMISNYISFCLGEGVDEVKPDT